MKDNSNRVVTLVLPGWLCFAVGLAGWFQNASALAVAATVLAFKFGWIMSTEGNRVELGEPPSS
jgi:ammonia channel protein AmtB